MHAGIHLLNTQNLQTFATQCVYGSHTILTIKTIIS